VVAPLLANRVVVGTLAVLRKNPRVLLQADVDFVDKVAELASLAFQRLSEADEQRIQVNLLRAVVESLQGNDGPDRTRRILHLICSTFRVGLEAEAAHVWIDDRAVGLLRGVVDAEGRAPRDLPWSAVEREMGPSGFAVVSDPSDGRLRAALEALPGEGAQRYRDCPRAGLLLARADHLKLLQPAFFFFVATTPRRLSFTRVQYLARTLATTLVRP
jgi:hypothetical protein